MVKIAHMIIVSSMADGAVLAVNNDRSAGNMHIRSRAACGKIFLTAANTGCFALADSFDPAAADIDRCPFGTSHFRSADTCPVGTAFGSDSYTALDPDLTAVLSIVGAYSRTFV